MSLRACHTALSLDRYIATIAGDDDRMAMTVSQGSRIATSALHDLTESCHGNLMARVVGDIAVIVFYSVLELINITVQHSCGQRQPGEVDGTSTIDIGLVKCRLGSQRQEKMDAQ